MSDPDDLMLDESDEDEETKSSAERAGRHADDGGPTSKRPKHDGPSQSAAAAITADQLFGPLITVKARLRRGVPTGSSFMRIRCSDKLLTRFSSLVVLWPHKRSDLFTWDCAYLKLTTIPLLKPQ